MPTEQLAESSGRAGWYLIGGAAAFVMLILAQQTIVYTGPPTKEEWLRREAARLMDLEVTRQMIAAAKPWEVQEAGESWYCGFRREGVIVFADGDWVYIVCHSFHANDPPGPNHSLWEKCAWQIRRLARFPMGRRYRQPVGDAILAIDQQGQLYTNDGHVCGGLQLTSAHPVTCLEDFLQTRTLPSDVGWKTMKQGSLTTP